ncbi:MAG: response regulator transcription factor [Acidimicrobiales bacterium]
MSATADAAVAVASPPPGAPSAPARVLLVEDHSLLAESLRICLAGEGYEVEVAPIGSREEVVAAARRLKPDAVLLDVNLGPPIWDGSSLVEPLARTGAAVVVVSGTTEPARVAACMEAGAAGFVSKGRSLDELVVAVADAVARLPLMADEERARLRTELEAHRRREGNLARLTTRESAVLRGLMDGRSVATMADDAFVSAGTVRSQIRAILTKLDVKSQLSAVAVARRAGWGGS